MERKFLIKVFPLIIAGVFLILASVAMFFPLVPFALPGDQGKVSSEIIPMVESPVFSANVENCKFFTLIAKRGEDILDKIYLGDGFSSSGKLLKVNRVVGREASYSYKWLLSVDFNMGILKDGRYQLEFTCRPRRTKIYQGGISEFIDPSVSGFELIKSGNRIGVASRYDIG